MIDAELKQLVYPLLKKVAPESEPEKLLPDDLIQRTLDIDSFDYLQFIVALSEKTGRDIPEEDYEKISSLNKLSVYLRKGK